MLHIPGYEIDEVVSRGKRSLILRGRRINDNTKVVIKTHNNDYPSYDEITRFRHEFEIGKEFKEKEEHRYLIKYSDLLTLERGVAILMEDIDARGLDKIIPHQGLTPEEFLPLALKILAGLALLHQKRIIHRDIKPANILINPRSDIVKLIDFGIALRTDLTSSMSRQANQIEGTMAYISPEQTGRTNRNFDHRADFYSLGITFYQLLTGRLPFVLDDPLELIHAHIARDPTDLRDINSEIPESLARITSKLMAKNPDDRYQSLTGLGRDLEQCQESLKRNVRLNNFIPGLQDYPTYLVIPKKLYGREKEARQLRQGFERSVRGGSEILLVSGFSGVGKSTFVYELLRPLSLKGGYFASTKIDQMGKGGAYDAFREVLRELTRTILGESESRISRWRRKITNTLETGAAQIVEFIPELEHLIGKEEVLTRLKPADAKKRFFYLIKSFIEIFARPEHPLVLFFDDVQWGASSDLELLTSLFDGENSRSLYIICAYRDNEVSAEHLALKSFEQIRAKGGAVSQIHLNPPEQEALNLWISDTLRSSPNETHELTKLIHQKTGGNPFFVRTFLELLYEDGLIFISSQDKQRWDLEGIKQKETTSNVADTLMGLLKKIPTEAQRLLQSAACLGNSFSVTLLSRATGTRKQENFTILLPAIDSGLLLADRGELKFSHDRIQEGFYLAIGDESERKKVHLAIGRQILRNSGERGFEDLLYEIADHFFRAGPELLKDHEVGEVYRLLLNAGLRSKTACAFPAALNYILRAREYENKAGAVLPYGDKFERGLLQAELEYINKKYDDCENTCRQFLSFARTTSEKIKIYIIQINKELILTRYKRAMSLLREAMELLGITLPRENLEEEIERRLQSTEELLADREILALESENMTDRDDIRDALRLLGVAIPVSYNISQELYTCLVLIAANLSLTYGATSDSALAYSTYGHILSVRNADYRRGYEFGMLGISISRKYKNRNQEGQSLFVQGTFLNHWTRHLSYTRQFHLDSQKAAEETGDISMIGFCYIYLFFTPFYEGKYLPELLQNSAESLAYNEKTQNPVSINLIRALQITIANLMGLTRARERFEYQGFGEVELRENYERLGESQSPGAFQIFKGITKFHYKLYSEALTCFQAAEPAFKMFHGHFLIPLYTFYYALTILETLRAPPSDRNATGQAKLFERLETCLENLEVWARACPENFEHMRCLLQAELSRDSGEVKQVISYLKQALSCARENKFVQIEAIILERAADFWFELGEDETAHNYLKKSHYAYSLWGAGRKVRYLEGEYPEILKEHTSRQARESAPTITDTIEGKYKHISSPAPGTNASSTGSTSDLLDLMTIVKATRNIAEEITLANFLRTLMRIIMVSTGARKGYFFINDLEKNDLLLQARGVIEPEEIDVLQAIALEKSEGLCKPIIRYVIRTGESLIFKNVQESFELNEKSQIDQFADDPYLKETRSKSLLCIPLRRRNEITGILYLENNLNDNVFHPKRIEVLDILLAQAAISLDNARIYERQEELVRERTRELEKTHAQLLDAAHQAGMAEVASNILHNVGNVLTSATVPAALIAEELRESRLPSLKKVSDLLSANKDNLTDFFADQNKGQKLPEFLENLSGILLQERLDFQEKMDRILESLEHIKEIIRVQQSYTGGGNFEERLELKDLVRDAIRLQNDNFKKYEIIVGVEMETRIPTITGSRHKILMILVNLLKNALDSVVEYSPAEKEITLFVREIERERKAEETGHAGAVAGVHIGVRDNGGGISPENLEKIFQHGFTTKARGHGFGLHSSANAAAEMGGDLFVNSEGTRKGAEFILALPLKIIRKNERELD